MDTRFTISLRSAAAPIWDAQYSHPFVRGIADGTLSTERFERWARQDYVFLIDYCRLLALGAARADTLATVTGFADLLGATAGTEMRLHRETAARLGITESELEATVPEPAVRAYTDYLLRTAALGDLVHLAGALLPCMWGFSELGTRLAAQRPGPTNPLCCAWIDSYADPAFASQAQWCRDLVDRLVEGAGPSVRDRVRVAFLESSRHELAFWDMAWGEASA
jgi:thiaminase (transcriptional activator TenA)